MNKKILIIICITLIVIAVGGITAAILLQPKHIEDRNYQVVETVKKDEITDMELSSRDFGLTTKDIGFEEFSCQETVCTATHDAYNEETLHDYVSLMKDEDGTIIAIGVHFKEKDFTVDNIYKQVNAIAKNFIGTEIEKDRIKNVKDNMPTSGEEQISIKSHVVGANTIEINMQKVVDTKYYLVKIGIFPTTFYEQMNGAN